MSGYPYIINPFDSDLSNPIASLNPARSFTPGPMSSISSYVLDPSGHSFEARELRWSRAPAESKARELKRDVEHHLPTLDESGEFSLQSPMPVWMFASSMPIRDPFPSRAVCSTRLFCFGFRPPTMEPALPSSPLGNDLAAHLTHSENTVDGYWATLMDRIV